MPKSCRLPSIFEFSATSQLYALTTPAHNRQLSAIKAWVLKYSRNWNGKRDVCARGCFFSYIWKILVCPFISCTELSDADEWREVHLGRLKTNLWINGEPSTLHLAQKHLQKSAAITIYSVKNGQTRVIGRASEWKRTFQEEGRERQG